MEQTKQICQLGSAPGCLAVWKFSSSLWNLRMQNPVTQPSITAFSEAQCVITMSAAVKAVTQIKGGPPSDALYLESPPHHSSPSLTPHPTPLPERTDKGHGRHKFSAKWPTVM